MRCEMKARMCAVGSAAMVAILFLVMAPAATAQITVTAANPPAAPPGSVNLSVAVSGSGFKKGAKVKFLLSGTSSTGDVTVNGSTFVSSGQVNATITVASTAVDASYDIVVTNTDGRSGKGTELFAVSKTANLNASNDHVNVTSTVYDVETSNNQLLLRSDDHNGQQQATYSVADLNVTSEVYGMWRLYLDGQNTRVVWLTFSSPAGTSSKSPVPDGYYNARVFSACFDASNNNVDLLTIPLNHTLNRCSLRVTFTYGGTQYVFVMSPNGNYPGTGWANVSCKAVSGSFCSSWSIVPNMDASYVGNNPTVADLLSAAPRTLKETFIGTYHNTYRIAAQE